MSALICYLDWLDNATRSQSSQDQLFPASNLYDQSIRGRVWRSAGRFLVNSTNNTIIFQESVGVDLTATISNAAYDNINQFLSAIKSALDAAGASTYTVTQDTSSKKIVITSDGLGGGGIFTLKWTDVLSTAADTIGFSTSGDDTGSLTYTADFVRIHTEEYLTWDMISATNPFAFIAIGKKGQAIKISESAEIRLQGSITNNFSVTAYDELLTYNEVAIIKLKDSAADGLHTTGLRYWRLKIVDRENANGYVELSNVFLGDYFTPTIGKVQFPLSFSGEDYSSTSRYRSGAENSARSGRTVGFSFDWFPLSTSEKETFDEIEYELGQSKPFYLVMDPNLQFGSSIEYNVRYVRLTSDIRPTLERPGIWTSSWSVIELL